MALFDLPMIESPLANDALAPGSCPDSSSSASKECATCSPCEDQELEGGAHLPMSPVLKLQDTPGKAGCGGEYEKRMLEALAVNVWHTPMIESPQPGHQTESDAAPV